MAGVAVDAAAGCGRHMDTCMLTEGGDAPINVATPRQPQCSKGGGAGRGRPLGVCTEDRGDVVEGGDTML